MPALIDYLSNGQITEAKDHLKQFHPETNPIPPQELSAFNERGDSVLYLAVLWGDPELVMSLLSFNIKINDTNEEQVTPLMIAYMLNKIEVAELLIRNGANVYALVHADFNLILDRFEASHYNYFEDDEDMDREYFLEIIRDYPLSLIALKNSSPEITIFILSIIKEIPKDFLIFAAENKDDDPTLVEYLLNQGVDVNAQDNDKKSALIAAASVYNNRILAHLLQAGAEINTQDARGKSALMICAFCNNKVGVKLLLNRHADVNLKNNNNRTALSLTFPFNRDTEILEMLVNEGADVNVPSSEDEPLLYSCAMNGNYENMVFLFQKGARAPLNMLEHALNHAKSKQARYSLFLSWQSPIITEEHKQFFQSELSKYTQIQSFLETCLSLPPSLPQLQSEAEALQQAETIEALPTTLLSFSNQGFFATVQTRQPYEVEETSESNARLDASHSTTHCCTCS